MAAVRDFADELEGYTYLPRLFDKARARLSGDTEAPPFGCPLDHSCLARLRVYPEIVLELVSENGDHDRAILAGLQEHGIPPATDAWFDAHATEDELLTGIYLKVRPRELLDELQPRPGQRVVAVEEGEALFFLGDRQMRIVRSGEVVRVPPELPLRIETFGEKPLRLDWLTGDPDMSPATAAEVKLAEYDPGWPALYEREAERIRRALGDRVLLLEHTGSTSVPGLAAKPRIDITLAVADSSDEDAYIPALEAAGYVFRLREPEWHEHRLLRDTDPDVNLHIFSVGSEEIDRMLRFRDRLRTDAADRLLYERTKRTLAEQSWNTVQDYADAKSDVVEEILRRAAR